MVYRLQDELGQSPLHAGERGFDVPVAEIATLHCYLYPRDDCVLEGFLVERVLEQSNCRGEV